MFDLQEELKRLPEKPGVYIMKDKSGDVIYVGKAVALKNRVRQYFHPSAAHSPKVAAMVEKVAGFEYIVTDTELEALILECNLIKKFKPKYNILLKDDKNYPYIKVTMNEEYPRILITRRVEKDGACYFGPYSNVFSVRESINFIKRLFPVKSCKRVLPRDMGKGRPCLDFHIGRCPGPCSGNVDRDEYRAIMKDICSFLEGRQDDVVARLENEMRQAADKLDFERAAVLRDKLFSLRHISEEQKVLSPGGTDRDAIGFAANKTDTCVQVFFVRGGKLLGREFFIIEGNGEGELRELASSFLKQFYGDASPVPPEIIIGTGFDDIKVVEAWLSSKRGGKVRITVPKRGEKLHMVRMVAENARIELGRFAEKAAGGSRVQEGLKGLAALLGLKKVPARLEAYDISNTGTSEMVGSMVVFENGAPDRKSYRRFKIRSSSIQNDYASMREVLERRFRRAILPQGGRPGISPSGAKEAAERLSEKERQEEYKEQDNRACKENCKGPGEPMVRVNHGEPGEPADMDKNRMPDEPWKPDNPKNGENQASGFGRLPDLVMVDGGLGHISAAREVLEKMGIEIPVCGMVKDDRHRTRGLVLPDREVELKDGIDVLRLVASIQEEAHRFALEYNRKLRGKRYSKSVLDEVEGIGPKRKKALLRHFGSLSRIRQAGVDDLQAVDGISRPVAEKLHEFLRNR